MMIATQYRPFEEEKERRHDEDDLMFALRISQNITPYGHSGFDELLEDVARVSLMEQGDTAINDAIARSKEDLSPLEFALRQSMLEAQQRETQQLEAWQAYELELGLAEQDHADEEKQTQALMRGINQHRLEAEVQADGAVRIGSRIRVPQECGSSHEGHSNLCGYLSLTGGDGPAAVALKQRLAPMANEIGKSLAAGGGALVDFSAPATMMNTEVVFAYVVCERTPVCVHNMDAGSAVCYRTDQCERDMVYLRVYQGHYTRLV